MSVFSKILVMALTTYCIRALPFILFRKPIQNRFVRSFLYYVPYAVLAAMTVPAVFETNLPLAASVCGVAAALICAWREKSLIFVACAAALAAAAVQLIF
jgi:branched-subunit amino acid transport protein